jgi:hypothetical protein
MVKTKNNHLYCPIPVFLLLTPIRRPPRRSSATSENCSNWRRGREGEREKKRGKGAVASLSGQVKKGHEQTCVAMYSGP